MLWLYNNKFNDNNTFDFYQVFIENNLVYDDKDENMIYSFNSTNLQNTQLNLNLNIDIDKYNFDNIECEIKIIDNIISYNILSKNTNENNKNYVFISKLNFIKPINNQFEIPIFSYTYKSTSTKKMPNLIESEYILSQTLNFNIYKLDKDNKIQFIIETNLLTNSIKKYFITTNLDLINMFIHK